jgi:hypothetical protein
MAARKAWPSSDSRTCGHRFGAYAAKTARARASPTGPLSRRREIRERGVGHCVQAHGFSIIWSKSLHEVLKAIRVL